MNIQPKDPSKNHFRISIVKSVLRMLAGTTLMMSMFVTAGFFFVLAEVFGVLEELV